MPPHSPRDPAAAAIDLLAQTWPATFFVFERRRRPLALGIREAIMAVLPSALTPMELRQALGHSDVPSQALSAQLIALLLPCWLEGLCDRSCRGEGRT